MHKHWNSSSLELKGIKLNCHTETKVTRQANSVLKVASDSLQNGKYPNGKVLSKIDKDALNEEIQACKNILINTGLLNPQLNLF